MTPNIVTTQWLYDHLEDPDVAIVDIRGKAMTANERPESVLDHYTDYVQSHIPGAVFVNWVEDITDDPQHKRVAPLQKYAKALSRLGITNDQFVVAYDDASNSLAARMWWTLNHYSHTQVAVLDGGWQKWLREERPVTDDMPRIARSQFLAQPRTGWLRQGNEIVQRLHGTTRIVDMRLPQEYNGEVSLARFSGHIPGATNLPVNALITDDHTLLDPQALVEQLAEVGVDDSAPEVIFYSNVGVASCLGILAMRVAGMTTPASNYDASWQEWGNDDRKPRE